MFASGVRQPPGQHQLRIQCRRHVPGVGHGCFGHGCVSWSHVLGAPSRARRCSRWQWPAPRGLPAPVKRFRSPRSGLDVPRDAAPGERRARSTENERTCADGTAARWGYLFTRRAGEGARLFGAKQEDPGATDLEFDFDAPPLAENGSTARPRSTQPGRPGRIAASSGGKLSAMPSSQPSTRRSRMRAWAFRSRLEQRTRALRRGGRRKGEIIRMWRVDVMP
jgi:hypothetical protein